MKRKEILFLACLAAICLVFNAAQADGSLTAAEISALITSYLSPMGEHHGEPLPAWLEAYLRGEAVEIVKDTPAPGTEEPQPAATPAQGAAPAANSAAPTVYAFSVGDTLLSGTGVSGARIDVQWPDGTAGTGSVVSGKWAFTAKGAVAAGGVVSVTQTEPGKGPCPPVVFTIDGAMTGRPQVLAMFVGDEALCGYGIPGAQIDVVWPGRGTGRAFVDNRGEFRIVAPNGITAGGTVAVTQTVLGKKPSTAFSLKVEMPKSERLAVDAFARGDATLSGAGVTGATITVVWPGDIDDSYTTIRDGRWSVPAPSGLAAGAVVYIVQVEPGKSVSEKSSVVVGR